MSTHPFSKLGVESWLIRVCEKVGYDAPTKIQVSALPLIIQGKHVIANSETGSGKTAVFGFPILQKLAQDPFGVFALVLTASRELAIQIYDQLNIFGASVNLRSTVVVGGMDMTQQLKELDEIPHIIVATPGRFLDMIEKSSVLQEYIQNLQFLVLDECDRLFEDSLLPDIRSIIKYLPAKKQVILATATLSAEFTDEKISQLLNQELSFEKVSTNSQKKIVESLTQKYVFMPDLVKDYHFIYLMKKFSQTYCIVFVNKCRQCQFISNLLNLLEFKSVCLHSLLRQGTRMANLKKFRNKQVNILVATDVASRGLDIPMVNLVVNYDMPHNSDDYIHRVGRTARKGKRGLAISVVNQYDVQFLLNIEQAIGEKLQLYPTDEDAVLEEMSTVTKAKKKVKLHMSEQGITEQFDKEESNRQSYKKMLKQEKFNQKQSDKVENVEKDMKGEETEKTGETTSNTRPAKQKPRKMKRRQTANKEQM